MLFLTIGPSGPQQTGASAGSHAQWWHRHIEPGVSGDLPQLQPLLPTGRGGQEQARVVEDLQELRGKSRSRARWGVNSGICCWWGSNASLSIVVCQGAERVDIGLPYCRPSRTKVVKERRQAMSENKRNVELERASRLRTCTLFFPLTFVKMWFFFLTVEVKKIVTPSVKIPLDQVRETWEKTGGPFDIKKLADHYGVFRDLFPMAYFLPQVTLRISYSQDTDGQVHYGNQLTPTEVYLK